MTTIAATISKSPVWMIFVSGCVMKTSFARFRDVDEDGDEDAVTKATIDSGKFRVWIQPDWTTSLW